MFRAVLLSIALTITPVASSLPVTHASSAGIAMHARPTPTPQFRHYGVADGLPSSNIYTMVQDLHGMLWLGTANGLVRFDGVHFRVFRHDPRNPHSLAANDISSILIDHHQRLWLGGEATGLNLYRPASGDFRTWRHHRDDPQSLGSDDIGALAEGQDGSIWVSVMASGLDRLRTDGHIEHFRHDDKHRASLASNIVLSLRVQTDGTVLIGSFAGLDRLHVDGHIDHVRFKGLKQPLHVWGIDGKEGYLRLATSRGLYRLGTDGVARRMDADVTAKRTATTSVHNIDGSLWIGTLEGLYWVGADGRHRYIPLRSQTPDNMPRALVWKLLRDREGGLWVSTRDDGLAYLGPEWRQFTVFRHRPGDSNSLTISRIVAQARWHGRLLVGGQEGRLDSISPDTGSIHHIDLGLAHQAVTALADAGNGGLWVGHTDGLLIYRNGHTQEAQHKHLRGGINHIVTDARGNAYVSKPVGGLFRVDRHSLKAVEIATHNGSTADRDVTGLTLHAGQVWRSSMGGLARLDPQSGEFVDVPGIVRGRIFGFAFGTNGLWLVRSDSMEHYRLRANAGVERDRIIGVEQGWPEIPVVAMACDADGRVWLTSHTGLWLYNPRTRIFRSYRVEDGLPSPEFSSHTLTHMLDGMIYSGTNHGVVGWYPANMRDHLRPPQLLLTSITVIRDGHVQTLPVNGKPLWLRWNDRELHIVAQALSYLDPMRNHYRFRLNGLDSNWVDTGTRSERDFTSLPYGGYTLHVEAAGPSGAWAASPSLSIHVARPPWQTGWAWMAYVLVALTLAWMLFSLGRRRIEARHRMQMAEYERTLAEQASDAKTSFLATLGHEIRTPMTGVLGMAELLLHSSLQPRQREYAEAIQRSGTLLLRLVNEALDVARIEGGQLQLELSDFAPRELLRDVLQLESGIADNKRLQLSSQVTDTVPMQVRGDALRIKQILLNLVNNALKFTNHGGVQLVLDWVDDGLAFTVSDTGPGIATADRSRLFQRYQQADSPQRSSGSGLGLAICSELAALMDGHCALIDTSPKGSTFRVWLPLPGVDVMPDEVSRTDEVSAGRSLLLIEDDATVAVVIQGLLEASGHRVCRVANGLAGLAEIENGHFDALLLDLDLPELDGFGVARMLREREMDTRLPIIAITARSGGDEEHRARTAGMDDFLRKPLSGEQLAAALRRVCNRFDGIKEPD